VLLATQKRKRPLIILSERLPIINNARNYSNLIVLLLSSLIRENTSTRITLDSKELEGRGWLTLDNTCGCGSSLYTTEINESIATLFL
jgi:hypothetical protein